MNALVSVPPVPAMTIPDVERVALAIAKGGLFGSKDPNAVLTLCLLAQAEGQHPAVVFRDYHIIQGRPAKKADAMLRDFITAGGKVEWHQLDDTKADATFSHPSGSARIDWTLERARKAGISNPMWNKYPRQMLRSRVISEGVRTVFPGATSGLYEENEVRDITGEVSSNPVMEAQEGGLVEGRFREGEVSPREPAKQAAHEELREQLEQSVEETKPQDPTKGWREPDSPYSTPTKLHKAMTQLDHDLNGCGDADMVYGVTTTSEWREFVRVAEKHCPHYLRGGEPAPEEFEGLIKKAERLVAEFDTVTANHMADVARA